MGQFDDILIKLVEKLPFLEILAIRSKQRLEHDQTVFERLNEVFSEDALERYLDSMYRKEVSGDTLDKLRYFLREAEKQDNQFALRPLRYRIEDFIHKLNRVEELRMPHYFRKRDDTDSGRYYLRPDQNEEFESDPLDLWTYEKVEELYKQIMDRVSECDKAYKFYRKTCRYLIAK